MGTGTGRTWLAFGVMIAAVVAIAVLVIAGFRLPGDFSWGSGNIRVYAPIATCLLVSVVVSIVLSILSRRR